MKQLLAPLVGDASPVTVIGLCKNAGKTTAMRRLMAELGEECLGLTSVGRDGECTDLVTGTEKPDLYLKKGDLFATARGMLTLCDATLEVVDLTDVMTPLGPVAVFRTLSDGYVQLAGPSAAGQLPPLTRRFQELGAQLLKAAGQRGELPGRRRPGQLHISVGQGAEHRYRTQGGHHVGEVHHLQRGVAQGEHTPRRGEQIAFFQVQIGLFRARHQVGALPVPAHRGQAQALLPQLRHQAAHGGGFARVFTETNHRHRRGIPHQGRQKLFQKTASLPCSFWAVCHRHYKSPARILSMGEKRPAGETALAGKQGELRRILQFNVK